MNIYKHSLALSLALFFPIFLKSQIKIDIDNVKATYPAGQKAAFHISSNAEGAGTYQIYYDPRDPTSIIKKGEFTFQQGHLDTIVYWGLPQAGVVFFRADQNWQTAITSVAFDPLSIQPLEPEPTDFDTFWKREKDKLKDVPMNPQLTLQNTLPNGSQLYVLRLDNVDGRTVNGYIVVPAGSGPFPAVVQLPPFGSSPVVPDPFLLTDFAEKCRSIAVMLTVHNTPPYQEDPNAYRPEDVSDPLKYYNRWALLGAIRAIEYLFSRPDFNGSLGVCGNSQGGGLSISLAGLDDRVKAVLAIAPANSEQQGTRYSKASGFPRYNVGGASLGLDTNLVKKASKYHDAMYFLKRYKGALMIQTGYKDDVTPSATHFAAYNQFSEAATMLHLRELGHNYPNEYWYGRYAFFHQYLTGFDNPFSFQKMYSITAGNDQKISLKDSTILRGRVFKDSTENTELPVLWEKISGEGTVTFENALSRTTQVHFSKAGTYVLRFSAEDEYLINVPTEAKYYSMRDFMSIEVQEPISSTDETEAEALQVVVLPNPSAGQFEVHWTAAYTYQAVIIYDKIGYQVSETTIGENMKDISLDLSKLRDDVYTLVMVNSWGHKVAKKIMKVSH